jgi:hypothetical protein
MSNYVKSTNFTAKDSLPTGDTNKVIRGSEFDTEFDAIATAVGTKSDLAGPTFTGTATFANLTATGTVNLTGATVSNLGTVTTVDINGGTIDGVTIGGSSAGAGTFSSLTATTADINGGTVDGATIGANSASTGNFTTLSVNGVAITATPAELNILDGVTASTAELNILDGVTATTAELNYVDGVTSNIQTQLDAKGTASTLSDLGVTATAAELNTLDGITASTAELNLVDGSVAGTIVNSKAVVYGPLGQVNATTLQIGGTSITSSPAELNILDGATLSTAELNILDGVTATTAELNILDGVTATTAELNILDGKTFLDEDDMVSNSATGIPSQQSVKAYVDSQTGGGGTTLSGLTDTNITTPADGAVLFYDTTTSKWIDNVVSGDITIADTGVAAIGSGVIVNADINASAAISVSKTALVDGTGLTLTGDTLSVDASQTQITAVGTIATGTWQGTAIADAYVADNLTISGGTVDNSVIGGTTAAAGTFTTLTGNQLDVDNIQIDANAVKSTNTNGNIELFPNGTGATVLYGNTNPGTVIFNCESNTHGVTLKGPAHAAASTYTVSLPDTLGTTQASGVVTSDANGVVTFDNGISEEYTAVTSSTNATTVNLQDGTNFSHTLTENTTFTFSNPASSGKVSAFTLKIVQDASASGYTVTWPGSVDWPSATAPTLTATASAVDYFVFITHDGGTTYYGFTAGQALG